MIGGGGFGWAPGEWTDDTSMAIAIAEVAAGGTDLRSAEAQDAIVARWHDWSRTASDVGNQTRSVLSSVGRDRDGVSAAAALRASTALHERTGHTAGNGSLMRTAPVALAYLHDEDALVVAASRISALTHFDPEAGEACVLWCLAIRHAVLTGDLDVRRGLPRLDAKRQRVWAERLDVAERSTPADFHRNGWVVEALQGAWSAIAGATAAPVDSDGFPAIRLRRALEGAVRGGRDADTVAAIAGGLAGAAYGASAVPAEWRRILHGWPGMRSRDLISLAGAIERAGAPDRFDYTYAGYRGVDALARHPYDSKVWLGGIGALRNLPAGVDAVVSLCRVGEADIPSEVDLVEIRLIDNGDPAENPHLDFVLDDAASVIEAFRAEGRTVLVHCVQAHSRTPAVAALYGMRLRGVGTDVALADVTAVLPAARPIERFRTALHAAERRR
jgi:ADP-ribosylglycohydrolase